MVLGGQWCGQWCGQLVTCTLYPLLLGRLGHWSAKGQRDKRGHKTPSEACSRVGRPPSYQYTGGNGAPGLVWWIGYM